MQYRSVFRPGAFEGQRIIVTGGGSGIGRCTAHELASLGAFVALVGRNREKLAPSRRRSRGRRHGRRRHAATSARRSRSTRPIAGMLARARPHPRPRQQCRRPVPGAAQRHLAEGLGGGGAHQPHRRLPDGARVLHAHRWRRTAASIVNIVADMWHGCRAWATRGAARAGMVNLTQTAAVEWGASGVRVNAVAPGWIASSGLTNIRRRRPAPDRRARAPRAAERFGTECEVSAAIVFLMSKAAAFISGAVCGSTAPCRTRVPTSTFRTMTAHAPIMASRSKHRSTSFRPWTSSRPDTGNIREGRAVGGRPRPALRALGGGSRAAPVRAVGAL